MRPTFPNNDFLLLETITTTVAASYYVLGVLISELNASYK